MTAYAVRRAAWPTLTGTTPDVVTFLESGSAVEIQNIAGTGDIWVSFDETPLTVWGNDCYPIAAGTYRTFVVPRRPNTKVNVLGAGHRYGALLREDIPETDRGGTLGSGGGGSSLNPLDVQPRRTLEVAASTIVAPVDVSDGTVSHLDIDMDDDIGAFGLNLPGNEPTTIAATFRTGPTVRSVVWESEISWVDGEGYPPIFVAGEDLRVSFDSLEGVAVAGRHGQRWCEWVWAGDPNTDAAATSDEAAFLIWRPIRLERVVPAAVVAPTGAALVYSIEWTPNFDATAFADLYTVAPTATRPTIAAGAKRGSNALPDATKRLLVPSAAGVPGALRVRVISAGTTEAGEGHSIQLGWLQA